jgi:tetratricopeptide (TPR) repeat protein
MNQLIEPEQAENDLLACAAFLAERIASADGHAASVSAAALRYAAHGEVDLAAELADSIGDPHTRDAVLSAIAARCAELNDDDYGFQLVEAMNDYGLQQEALHKIAARQAAAGRFDDALETAKKIDDSFAAVGEIAARFAQTGNFERARNLLEQIDFPSVRMQVLNEIAATQIKRGESPVETLNESIVESKNLEIAEERVQLFLDIAARFCEAGEREKAAIVIDRARQLAERLDARFRDAVFAQIALQHARLNDFAAAESALLAPIADLQQIAAAHVGIAAEHAAAEDFTRAVQSLEEAFAVLKSQPERQIRDSKARFDLWATIAVRLAQYGKPERGLEIALENPDEEPRDIALKHIAAICAAQNKNELARQTISAVENFSARVFALVEISDAETKKGDAMKALQFLNEAHGLSEEIEQLAVRSNALNQIAERFAAQGENAAAVQILRESLEIIEAIRDYSHQSNALLNLAETYDKLNIELSDDDRRILKSIVRRRLM